jgi:propionyl-CoA carboxylase beta chain
MYHCPLNVLLNLPQDKSLRRIVPDDPNTPYDMHDIISKIVDDNDFFEIMPHYAMNLIVGFARYSRCLMY